LYNFLTVHPDFLISGHVSLAWAAALEKMPITYYSACAYQPNNRLNRAPYCRLNPVAATWKWVWVLLAYGTPWSNAACKACKTYELALVSPPV